jgi:hypothetical protein
VDDHVVTGRQIFGFDVLVHGFRQGWVVFLAGNRQDTRRFVDHKNILVLVDDDKILFGLVCLVYLFV